MEEKIEVPKSLWEQFGALFAGHKPEPQTPATVTPEQFAAAMQERDDMKARLDKLEAEKQHAAKVDQMTATLQDAKKFGKVFEADTMAAEAAEVFSGLNDAQLAYFSKLVSALSNQVKYSKLLAEFGQTGDAGASDPKQEFAAVIANTMKEQKVDYMTAFNLARAEHPEMAEAYDAAVSKKQIVKESE